MRYHKGYLNMIRYHHNPQCHSFIVSRSNKVDICNRGKGFNAVDAFLLRESLIYQTLFVMINYLFGFSLHIKFETDVSSRKPTNFKEADHQEVYEEFILRYVEMQREGRYL